MLTLAWLATKKNIGLPKKIIVKFFKIPAKDWVSINEIVTVDERVAHGRDRSRWLQTFASNFEMIAGVSNWSVCTPPRRRRQSIDPWHHLARRVRLCAAAERAETARATATRVNKSSNARNDHVLRPTTLFYIALTSWQWHHLDHYLSFFFFFIIIILFLNTKKIVYSHHQFEIWSNVAWC